MTLFFMLLVMWLILCSRFTLEVLLIGAALSAGLSWFCHAQHIWPRWVDRAIVRLSGRIVRYLWRLLGHMLSSSLRVCALILSPSLDEVEPKLLFFEPPLKEEGTRVVLGNSITLTPGTFTVGLYGSSILCIHALNGDMAEGARHLDLTPRLQQMEDVIHQEQARDREARREKEERT